MPAYKQKNGTWSARFYYKDFTGKSIPKQKRGFKTKREALEYERKFIDKMAHSSDMLFSSLWKNYQEDKANLIRPHTWSIKMGIFEKHILPYFENFKITEITTAHIVKWQNEILDKQFAPTYTKTINNQLSAILNHAVRYYGLPKNPVRLAGSIGKKQSGNIDVWTLEDLTKVLEYYETRYHPQLDNKMYQAIFALMFFTGIRVGEMLALTHDDIDFENKTVAINKSYQRLNGKDVITTPKTDYSIATLSAPDLAVFYLKQYIDTLYEPRGSDRLFYATGKSQLSRQITTISSKIDVPRIRVHDLRHSHATFLIKSGVNIKIVQHRMRHKDIQTTLNTYAHLWDGADKEATDLINQICPKHVQTD